MESIKNIKRLEITLALLLVFIPLILKFIDGNWRPSISNYAYSSASDVFVMLLTLSGALFVYNSVWNKRHWYNLILGFSLIGVAVTPHLDFPVSHYLFASIFFIGSIVSIGLSTNKWLRNFKYLVSGIILLGLIFHFAFNLFSLLFAEWIGIVPISFHFIVKSIKN